MTDYEKAEQLVCISCVEEVRYSFVSHLAEALCRKGINYVVVDVDNDDLLSKERHPKVSLMVLPGNYEPTTAWVDKFEKVLKCQRNNDQVVVPVLYGDCPLYGKWLTALDLRCLSPIHQSRKECSDSKLVEEIVRDVYEKLFYMVRIGMYSKLLEMEEMVCKQPLGVRRIGIWGMPGIGKTTLAKAVFDQMWRYFDAYCFIEDYEKAIHNKGLYRMLEEQLLKANPGGSGIITNLSLLRDILSSKRVLVVLDDVRNPRVSESFLNGFEFCPGSLIIITSRDKQVFRICEINQIYEVQGLYEKEALQLFMLCASINDLSEQNLHKVVMEVIKYANGNPLALRIYGEELKCKKSAKEMETTFLEFKERPPDKLIDAIKRSYDTLSDSEKNIFLDIACFFQGENVNYVMQLLEGCGFFPHVGVDVLIDKCLVTISENRVWMHNLIQDFGRQIINGETVQIKRRARIRLWEPHSIKHLFEDNEHIADEEPKTTFERAQDTEEIEGIFMDTSDVAFDMKLTALVNMPNLRLLKIYCSNPENLPGIHSPKGFLRSLPTQLRLLHWENYPLQYLPQNFDPRYLVEINMPYSQLQTLWGGTKNLEMLRTIRLCHSQQLVDIDDLLKSQNLEVIDLQGCTRLQSFPATGQLLHLRVVNLSGCTEIKVFPEAPPNIEELHLQGTGITELPLSLTRGELVNLLTEIPGLSGVSNLEYRDLERLTGLMKVSLSTQELRKLIFLEMKDCSHLRSLPNMINLELLTVLDLSGCSKLESIQGFPRNLKELYLTGTAVKEVPQLPQSLELFNAHGCVSLKLIPLDSKKLPMRYTFSNCFNLSPQVINDFLVKVLGNVNRILEELPQELNEAQAFSFCAPSHGNQNSTLDLKLGSFSFYAPSHGNQDSTLDLQLRSSVMIRLNPSWKSTLVGFAMLVEVAFSDYNYAYGFGIKCVCRWKNKEGHTHRIERNLHCWAAGKTASKVQNNHMFVFCDVKMRPSTGEGNDPNILADLVLFEFFPFNKEKCLDDSCTVKTCGVYAINGNTDLKMSSPVLSLDPMDFSGNEVEEVLRVSYDGLMEMDKALFRYIACLFSEEDVNLVTPLGSVDVDINSGLKELASKSLIRVSPNGEIVMHSLQRKMGKEILRSQSMLPSNSKEMTRDIEKVSIASSSHNWKYDVFPSFSGEDVSKSFLSHLIAGFKDKSIITFLDNEIVGGKLISHQLVQAMRESRISIVVFSKRYASSSWLLSELVEIIKCKQEFGQIVIPVFYDVDPSEVRRQAGRHFKLTYKGTTEDDEQQWQQALADITNIDGCHYMNRDNEAEMIVKIATEVSNKLNRTPSADFDGLVGINAHIAKMIPLLRLESKEVKMVGIWGPSGIGKTTIARYIYSKISSTFQCSALIDISNVCIKRGYMDDYRVKLYFQELVLSEITHLKDARISHLGVMRERLMDKKVLLILDHVDDRLVLDAMVGDINWFGPGSRIIVIPNNLGLLKSHGISDIYKVDLPSKKEALQMICQFAFGKNSPPDGFMELATEVVKLTHNLPLGLRYYGSYFGSMSKPEWLKELSQLKSSSVGKIDSNLNFGYDALSVEEQDLFIYVSCLFNHCSVEYLTRLLASDFDVKTAIRRLEEESLIHISEHGNVTMPLPQQQLGRKLAGEYHGWRFLVNWRDICKVFEENTGTKSVEGISLDMSEIKELLISERGFNEMLNLQFLKFYKSFRDKEVKVRLPHGLDYLSHKLRLLHWEDFPMRCMPSNFVPECLVELTMVASKFEELWSGIQPLESLKCMNLRGSLALREIPDLTYAINLETLDLAGCSSLTKLPSSIGNLHKLKDLDMEHCTFLEVLPTGINLESLDYLNLSGCSRLRSFPEISRSISDLYLDGTAIEEIPSWIENISGLSYLSMNGCNNLKKISPNISKLKLLEEVDFSACIALTEESWRNHPEELCTSLMTVNMSGNSYERLPDTWTSIQPKDLDLDNCRNLVSLPELPASLSILTANYCEALESLYGSFQQRQMALQFINCYKLNHQAREYIVQSDCAYAILPGDELPAHFTHRADGNFLTVCLPRISLSRKIPSFKGCIVVESILCQFDFEVSWLFRGKEGNKYFSLSTAAHSKTNHLIIFGFEFSLDEFNNHPAELNNSDVKLQFICLDHKKEVIKIKECGVNLLEDSASLDNSMKRFKTEESGEDDAEASRSTKQMRL